MMSEDPAEANGLERVKAVFRAGDSNGDGKLGLSEFENLLADVGWNFTRAEADKLFLAADKDSTGSIDVMEFLEWLWKTDKKEDAEIARKSNDEHVKWPGRPCQDTKDTGFADLLERQCLAVVKSTYFYDCLEKGEPFQDRARIPPEFIYTGREVLDNWTVYGARFLVILSYGWLSQEHPDPELYHLRRLVRVLKEMQEWDVSFHAGEKSLGANGRKLEVSCGVILDFCSLWQRQGKDETRSGEELKQFKEGLSEINTPYGHQEVTSLKFKGVPASEPRKYDDRGWTLFESTVIDAKGASGHLNVINTGDGLGKLNVLTFTEDFDPEGEVKHGGHFLFKYALALKRPPLTPDKFEEAMHARGASAKRRGVDFFTNGRDQPFVLEKYTHAFAEMTRSSSFDFSHAGWGDQEIETMAEVLRSCQMLKSLELCSNKFGPEGAAMLAAALPQSLERIDMDCNAIGPRGVAAMAAALPSCHSLSTLMMHCNEAGPEGAEALAASLPSCLKMATLAFGSNAIGNHGATKLAEATAFLPNLVNLILDSNGITNEGGERIAKALVSCPKLLYLSIGQNDFDETVKQRLQDAAPATCSIRW